MKKRTLLSPGAGGLVWLGAVLITGAGCMSPGLSELATGLQTAAATHPDPGLVVEGLPAYLLLVDAVIINRPDDSELLLNGAALYTTYAGMPRPGARTAETPPARSALAADRGLDYAMQAWRLLLPDAPNPRASRYRDFERAVGKLRHSRQALLHGLGTAWMTWCRLHADDILAAAELPRAELLLRRGVELDPAYRDGAALLMLGAVAASLPAEMGGDLEAARRYFDRALELESPSPLAPVLYARTYAVAVKDRQLFDRLLLPLVGNDTSSPTWVTSQARTLLQQADDLFGPSPVEP